jgi:hypothetical protein
MQSKDNTRPAAAVKLGAEPGAVVARKDEATKCE